MTPDFLQSLTILLIGLLFFKENVLVWISKKLGFTESDDTPLWAQKLTHHFNHETSEYHREHSESMRDLKKQHDNMQKGIDHAVVLLENQDKYGIKTRKE